METIWQTLTTTLVGFAAHLVGFLKVAVGFLAARVLAALGLSFVSLKYVMPDVKAFIMGYMTGVPSVVSDMAGAMGVDVFMTLIASALVTKVGFRAFLVGVEQLQEMIGNAGG